MKTDPAIIAQLVAQLGLPLVQEIVTLFHPKSTPITDAQWNEVAALGSYTSTDSLAALGYKIEDGKLVQL